MSHPNQYDMFLFILDGSKKHFRVIEWTCLKYTCLLIALYLVTFSVFIICVCAYVAKMVEKREGSEISEATSLQAKKNKEYCEKTKHNWFPSMWLSHKKDGCQDSVKGWPSLFNGGYEEREKKKREKLRLETDLLSVSLWKFSGELLVFSLSLLWASKITLGLARCEYDLGALTNLLGKGLCVLRETTGEERQKRRAIKTRKTIWKIRLLEKKEKIWEG